MLANVRPSGEHLFEDVNRAGGVGAVLHELAPLLDTEALTVTGRTLGEEIAAAEATDRDVIARLDAPRFTRGRARRAARKPGAPSGAIIKLQRCLARGCSSRRSPAVVFEDVYDLAEAHNDSGRRDGGLRLRDALRAVRRAARVCRSGASCRYRAACSSATA